VKNAIHKGAILVFASRKVAYCVIYSLKKGIFRQRIAHYVCR